MSTKKTYANEKPNYKLDNWKKDEEELLTKVKPISNKKKTPRPKNIGRHKHIYKSKMINMENNLYRYQNKCEICDRNKRDWLLYGSKENSIWVLDNGLYKKSLNAHYDRYKERWYICDWKGNSSEDINKIVFQTKDEDGKIKYDYLDTSDWQVHERTEDED